LVEGEKELDIVFHHICIETNCYDTSLEFYKEVFGFSIIDDKKNFHGREHCTWIKKNDVIIELQTPKELLYDTINSNVGIMHVCFKVKNLEKALNEIEKHNNIQFVNGKKIYEVEGNKLMKIMAPEGTIIEIRE
jgi:glyoxylase I family protein